MVNDYDAIKAGVNSGLDDAPGPSLDSVEASGSDSSGGNIQGFDSGSPVASANSPEPSAYASQGYDSDRIQEIAESIINEKWQELLSSVGNIAVWKEKVDTNIVSIKQEIVRINDRFDNLQNAVLGKVKEYDNDMRNVSTEMKALEKVFDKIIEPLTSNVKELNRITKELKDLKP